MVTYFQYLVRVISAADYEWTEVVRNLSQARAARKKTTIILSREVVETRVSGFFLKSVVQAVLIFGSDIWVVTNHMGRDLGGGFRNSWKCS